MYFLMFIFGVVITALCFGFMFGRTIGFLVIGGSLVLASIILGLIKDANKKE